VTSITDQSADRSLREPPDEPLSEFEIDPTPIWPAEDGRLEPIFLAGLPWVEFEEFEAVGTAPLPVEAEGFAQLDPERSEEEPDEPSPAPRQRASAISFLGSLGVHLPTLLVLILWSSTPAEIPGAIPVQLVVEESPAAPDVAQADRSVSESASETPMADNAAASPAAVPPVPPQPHVAEITPPPKPNRSPPLAPAALPKPAPSNPAPPAPAVKPTPPAPNPAPPEARVPGSDATRGDYLDYLVTLTRGHFDILPLTFLAGRHGRTTLSVLVFEDGTISRIAVKQSSGYPDIDAKIEQMVAAVGRFPPVPESFKRPSVELDFNMIFPDALQQQ
jgi:periplasmic protein TonB